MRNTNKVPFTPLLKRHKFIFDLLKNSTDAYLYCTDVKTRTTMISPNIVRDFDFPAEVVTNLNDYWLPLVHPHDRPAYSAMINSILEKHTVHEFALEYRLKTKKGDYVWIRGRGRLGLSRDGEPELFAGIITRMAGRNQADEVTGLLNKYRFEHGLRMALRTSGITGEGGAIIFVGLDNFKFVNETANRIVGDEFLRRVAAIIENILPPMLTLYKMDGDVFAVIYPEANETVVGEFFNDLQRSLAQPIEISGRPYFCTASAGTVFYPDSGKDYLILQKYAEAALDMAKKGGKNNNCLFNKEVYNRWLRSIALRDSLFESVESNCAGFELYFQPQVNAKNQELVGAEALLRWFNAKGKMVAPMEIIPTLEETKLILPVGKWIFEEAVKVCRKWRRINENFKVSVNMSYDQVKDSSFREYVINCLNRWQVPPEAVVLELTESRIVADWHFVNREFDEFRRLGIKIAMDDFGTGYSSLAMLKNLSCDIVKIDRAFVREIEISDFDLLLVKYAVDLCHRKGMRTCIEGVEEESAYRLLADKVGADYIQGYLFGRPEAVGSFEEKFLR